MGCYCVNLYNFGQTWRHLAFFYYRNYTAVCETFSCLFQTLGYFGRLAKIYKGDILKACSAQLMALPEKMVSYQATSKIHPLASAVVFVLTNACDNSLFLPLVIKALVQVLDLRAKDSVRKVCSNWSLVGVKQFMKNVLSKSEEARNLFMDQGIVWSFILTTVRKVWNCAKYSVYNDSHQVIVGACYWFKWFTKKSLRKCFWKKLSP